ncbi:uncharacterized protein MELLADRAFT_110757 [Melampsora larici-populina 98AG31]|uniref:Uncharacterized protein n=1 Tax=Melampsora larici-populina (strain 98AG31 / pathotype 3-4-7) TaxID=747676 RepID=F4S0V1_MELLP|nr:uncharacterized protein MELLADRAFT_110757 [Melampsora larici-populina 98AG31]EGG01654.1 hypothetical protein MELLADRAFT_110757 [Melampsora larici-populina 98AG31]
MTHSSKPVNPNPSTNIHSPSPLLSLRPSSVVEPRSQDQSPSPDLAPDCVESYDPTYGLRSSRLSEVLDSLDDNTKAESIMPTSPCDALSPPPPYSLLQLSTSQIKKLKSTKYWKEIIIFYKFPFDHLIILGGGGVDKSALTVQFSHDMFGE